jgi:hypothetical protein
MSHAIVPISPFLLPPCVACGGPTMLARLDPERVPPDAHDRRMFVSTGCGAQQTDALVRRKN